MSLFFANLDAQRRAGAVLTTTSTWILAAVIVAARAVEGLPILGFAVAAVGVGLAVTAAMRWAGATSLGRSLTGVGLMAEVSLLVAAAGAGPWQLDMHMAYFAALALLVIYCDWAVIAAAAATVAVHHLTLSYLLPAAVFPGSASLGRVLVHAVILVVEAAILIWVTSSVNRMFAASSASLARAEEAIREAEAANLQASDAREAEETSRRIHADAQARADQEREAVVRRLAESLARLARGDLSFTVDDRFNESYEQLRTDLNTAVGKLAVALREIEGDVGGVRRGSDQIAGAIGDLSQRTEQQAASLAETAAAMDEITATVRQTAIGARRVVEVVGEAREAAALSNQVVAEAVAAMGGIETSSNQISQIIGVIDEIAFQTNLLALNAGVEAARAGDAGKGFAVVASEVRALAQRSAEAAKEIKTLISTSTRQVGEGVTLVGRTGEALDSIVRQIVEVSGLVSEISNSAQEQAVTLGEVNTAINQIDRALQQNAAMVEETSAATQTLNGDAKHLRKLVAGFELPAAATAAGRVAA
ncbi:MAG: methyl-accepting chemotaxis protein [Proteobacteria bacterium]|nr:methyl-accepting chemotaxis protein [Pseudomonadota bacterium]